MVKALVLGALSCTATLTVPADSLTVEPDEVKLATGAGAVPSVVKLRIWPVPWPNALTATAWT